MHIDKQILPRRYYRGGVHVLARIAIVSATNAWPVGVHLLIVPIGSAPGQWETVVTAGEYTPPSGLPPEALDLLQKLADFLSVLLLSGALDDAARSTTETMQQRLLIGPDSPIGVFLDTQLKAIETWTMILSSTD